MKHEAWRYIWPLFIASLACAGVQSTQSPAPTAAAVGSNASTGSTQSLVLPEGTEIAIRTIDRIDSKTADTYREYAATLDDPVVVNGLTVLPAKTNAFFRVNDIEPPGFRRPASLSLTLVAVTVSGVRVSVETSRLASEGEAQGKNTAKAVAIGGAVGAVIGVMAGRGMGAVIGATLGAAGGAFVSKLFGKGVEIAPETRFTYKLTQPAVINFQIPSSGPIGAPVQVLMGESIAEVTGALGAPLKIESSGIEDIYFFKDRKVTFRAGKVIGVNLVDESPTLPASGETRPPIASSAAAEPEIAGAVYMQDEKGKLILLEKIAWRLRGLLAHVEVEGEKSTIRLKAGQKMMFAVKLEKGMDPHIVLFPLEATEKGRRRTRPSEENKSQPETLRVNASKFGESSYSLTAGKDLGPGEYGFLFRKSAGVMYCFGVD